MAADPDTSHGGKEPIFTAISAKNAAMNAAYAKAAASLPRFIEHLEKTPRETYCSAKLKFRDPDESERLGEDRFVYLWLGLVHYHTQERVFSGEFFELPKELLKWHQVGQRLAFEGEDIFDWMVLTRNGHLSGGYTLRVTRSAMPEAERADYDRHIGVSVYESED